MKVPGLRSLYEKVGGIVYFGRMLDKIRLHASGRLPEGYNLGTKVLSAVEITENRGRKRAPHTLIRTGPSESAPVLKCSPSLRASNDVEELTEP
jgi:hypothetical protein